MVIELDDNIIVRNTAKIKKRRAWRYAYSYMFNIVVFLFSGGFLAKGYLFFGTALSILGWAFWFYFMPGYLGIKNEVRPR